MEPFDVYRYYLALKLHFTTDKYDVVKQRGRVRATRESFLKRTDLMSINKVAKTYSDADVANFLVANFVSGDRWGGVFDTEAATRYTEWKGRIESLQYQFQKDLDYLILEMDKQNRDFAWAITVSKDEQHPYIIKSYMRGTTSIETMVILDSLYSYVQVFDAYLKDDLVWPDLSRIIRKYKPFLKFSKEKYNEILTKRLDSL